MIGLQQGFVTFASVLSAIALNALWEDALLVVSIWLLLRVGRGSTRRRATWCGVLRSLRRS